MDEFRIFFIIGLDFQSLTHTKRLTSEFFSILRAFRVFLILINRHLNIEERHTAT
jgi:hypothetical protein